jgi:hypothetical protein
MNKKIVVLLLATLIFAPVYPTEAQQAGKIPRIGVLAFWSRILPWRGFSYRACSLARCAEVVTLKHKSWKPGEVTPERAHQWNLLTGNDKPVNGYRFMVRMETSWKHTPPSHRF